MKHEKIIIRRARHKDLTSIVEILADDPMGRSREDTSLPIAQEYIDAFAAIERDANQFLAVAVDDEKIVGTLQITFIPGLSRKGSWRGQIEAVRVAKGYRNAGLGEFLFQWAIEKCKLKGCSLIQLTTDKSRPDAHRFYERLNFVATHEGYKLVL